MAGIRAFINDVTITADEDMMSQVWVNLIHNSIKFTPEGGRVRVDLHRQFAFMGVVSLVGIAVNNAIVLVDFINYLRKKGYDMLNAITEAGKIRFLPIVITSMTTTGAILPLALKDPMYGEMGFTLIFGLMTSTVLTLVVIPVLYSLVEELKSRFQKRSPVLIDKE